MAQVPALIPPARTPALVQADGMTPLRRAELAREVGGASLMTSRSIVTGHPAEGLTPERLAALLRGAESGDAIAYLELAEQMEEKDLHYLSVLGTRKRQVSQLPITVEAASDSKDDEEDAQLARGWFERDTIESDLFDILDAIGKGFSLNELIWNTAQTPWLPERIEWRDPRWFEFDRVDGRTPLLRGTGQPQPLEPFKWISHVHVAKSGLPIRGGLARPVAWAYLFKNYGLKDWVAFAEIFGLPFRVGKYENGATEADIRTLMRAVANIGTDAAAVFPKSMEVEFISAQSTGAADLYQRLCEYLDKQISKAVLGQTATTDSEGGGLGGSGKEHNDVRGDIEASDAKLLAATLNRDIVRPIVMLNRGVRQRYPRVKIGREDPTDLEQWGTFVSTMVALGMPVTQREVRQRGGLSEPKPGEALLAAPQPAVPAAPQNAPQGRLPALVGSVPAETASTRFLRLLTASHGAIATAASDANPAAAATPDLIDRFVTRELGDWEALLAPALVPIDALLAGAQSLEEVQARLATAAADMGTDALTELLAQGLFAARIAGVAGASIETS